MNKQELIGLLERESYASVSGITVECANWPGYETAYRMISKHIIGPWKPSVMGAIEAYTEEKEFKNNAK